MAPRNTGTHTPETPMTSRVIRVDGEDVFVYAEVCVVTCPRYGSVLHSSRPHHHIAIIEWACVPTTRSVFHDGMGVTMACVTTSSKV